MAFRIEPIIGKLPDHDTLRIDQGKGRVTANLRFIQFRDKDTRQIIIYIPTLEITAYGSTEQKAQEMLNLTVEEYFHSLMSMSRIKLTAELAKFGWKHDKIRGKEYSKCFVDANGILQEFNAVEDDVKEGVFALQD